jgi:hypothetical protein
MIVDRHHSVVGSVVEVDRLVVFDVLENINVFPADRLKDFRLDFAVREKGVPGVDFEVGGSVFVGRPRHVEKTRVRVVREVDLPYRQFLADVIPRGKGLCLPVEASLVNPGQLPNHLVRECFCAGASENSQLCGVGITHGIAALGMEWLAPTYTETIVLSIGIRVANPAPETCLFLFFRGRKTERQVQRTEGKGAGNREDSRKDTENNRRDAAQSADRYQERNDDRRGQSDDPVRLPHVLDHKGLHSIPGWNLLLFLFNRKRFQSFIVNADQESYIAQCIYSKLLFPPKGLAKNLRFTACSASWYF